MLETDSYGFFFQAHFEESQFECQRTDGRRLLKRNAVPTLFDVPNKPKPVTLKRSNPLQQNRYVTNSIASSTDVPVAIKRPRCVDGLEHSYSRPEAFLHKPSEVRACDKKASCHDHSYVKCVSIHSEFCFVIAFQWSATVTASK